MAKGGNLTGEGFSLTIQDWTLHREVPLEAYVEARIEEGVRRPMVDDLLAPLRAEVRDSGITEDELTDLLERAKHAQRRSRGMAQ